MRYLLSVCVCGFLAYTAVSWIRFYKLDASQLLIAAAQRIDADQLLVLRNGVQVVRWTSGRFDAPHQLMSVTKSVVALAIGKLVDDGKIRLSDRLDHFYPILRRDPRGAITVEQVLEQTSGLGSTYPESEAGDVIEVALSQPLLHVPGTKWVYNNDAVNLLSGIVQSVTGKTLEKYVEQVLFTPLEIKMWSWDADAQGHAWVMCGLALGPDDLAKIGQLVLDEGRWSSRQVLSRDWIRRLLQPSVAFKNYGALWWIGIDFLTDVPASTRTAAQHFVWAQGADNQLLVVDFASKTVLVLQTEVLRRESRDDIGGPLGEILSAYCAFTKNSR